MEYEDWIKQVTKYRNALSDIAKVAELSMSGEFSRMEKVYFSGALNDEGLLVGAFPAGSGSESFKTASTKRGFFSTPPISKKNVQATYQYLRTLLTDPDGCQSSAIEFRLEEADKWMQCLMNSYEQWKQTPEKEWRPYSEENDWYFPELSASSLMLDFSRQLKEHKGVEIGSIISDVDRFYAKIEEYFGWFQAGKKANKVIVNEDQWEE